MSKKKNTPLNIFMESLKLYFSNFDKFVKYMTFPVLGQITGLSLSLLLTYFYAIKMPVIIDKIPVLNNFWILVCIAILITLPGLAIFVKAFWEYLVAYGAVNSMFENMIKSGKVYDFDAHTELIKRRTISFVGVWFLFGIFSLLASFPLLWVVGGVFAIFFVLVFQVFTFEPELSPLGCVKRSMQLVKGHFANTFMLFAMIGALTYILVPQIVNLFFEYTNVTYFLTGIIRPLILQLPLSEWNSILAYAYLPALKADEIAVFTITTFIAQIFIQYTLPLRSILWAMWYKELNGGKIYINKEDKPKKKRSVKRPSEKLMEESHKKFATKKLDRNILKRVMEKDE